MREHHHTASPYEPRYGFSRAVRVGDRVVVAGTAPIGPDGRTVEGEAYDQARRCFELIVGAVEALGGRSADVVRTRMFLIDPADADAVGRAHREAVGDGAPAATMVVVRALIDPAWRVEIEAEAVVDGTRQNGA